MTNEEYIKAIGLRTSRRTYTNTPLDETTVNIIKDMVDYVNQKAILILFLLRMHHSLLMFLRVNSVQLPCADPIRFPPVRTAAFTAKRLYFSVLITGWAPAGFRVHIMKIKCLNILICQRVFVFTALLP